jgi:Carboxypeptidase regulatory-like domain/TonB-dependent Receptor Plug Domain
MNRIAFAKLRSVAVFLLACLCMPLLASAQSIVTGGITGSVTDPSGALVVGATASLKSSATGDSQSQSTSSSGTYQFSLLKPGTYNLTISHDGFKTVSISVVVQLGQLSTQNVSLEVGTASTTVEVNSQEALLQTENANITTTFDTHMVDSIPNPGNDITYVAQTAPGVSMNTSSGNGYGNFSAFGLPGTANLFTINGNDYNDPFLNLNNSGASNLLLGTNDVQEVAVVSNGYTGQYGRQAGAQIDVSSKSGTNAFHGNANYYWTGDALNANEYFLKASGQTKPFQNNNNWAASIGGPIKKDKAFFFVDTEGLRYEFATASQAFLPTPAFQSFVLGQNPTETSFYNQIFNLYNGVKGIANAQPQTGTCPGIGGAAVNALPGGSTSCLESIFASGASGNKEWLLIGRVDYNLTDNDKIYGRVKFDRGTQPTYADPINSAFNAISVQPQNEGQLNYTHVFNPTVVNNFVFSNLWYSAIFKSSNLAAGLSAFPEVLCAADTSMSCLGPTGGEAPFAFYFPQGRNVEQWQLVDDLSVSRGKHNFKMGGNFRRDDVSDYRASQNTFYPVVFATLADFASNSISTNGSNIAENFALTSPQPLAIYSFGLYFQDEFRVSTRLKLTLALRADRNSGGKCQSDCVSRATVPFGSLGNYTNIPYNQLVTAGQGSVLPSVEKIVFEPRIGFAWSPIGNKTVVRGGVGLFSDLYPGTVLDNFTTNFPEVNSFSFPGGTLNPADAGSGANLIAQCNAAFVSNYKSGGNLASYQSAAPAACAKALPSLYDVVGHLNNPKYVEWNAEIQHNLTPNTLFSVNYVGNRGYDLLLVNPYMNGFCTPTACGMGFTGLPTAPTSPELGLVQQLTNAGYSNYNGVTASIHQNVRHGLSAQFNYTYSHANDNVSNGGLLPYSIFDSILTQIDPQNPKADYSSSDYDVRHQLSANYVWDLPFKASNSLLDRAVGGWQVSGTFFYRAGLPFSIVDGSLANGFKANNLSLNGSPFATVLYEPTAGLPRNFGNSCVNTACFSTTTLANPTNFDGNARNAFRGPDYFNTDLSLRKTFKVTERMDFVLGANAFNILNHVNFQNPQTNSLSSSFGKITSAVSPPTTPYGAFASAAEDMRILQIVAKLRF